MQLVSPKLWVSGGTSSKTFCLYIKILENTPKSSSIIPEAAQARLMLRHLPVVALDMIQKENWPGDGLLTVEDNPLTKPSATTIAENYCLLKPLVQYNPSKVSIAYEKVYGYLRYVM